MKNKTHESESFIIYYFYYYLRLFLVKNKRKFGVQIHSLVTPHVFPTETFSVSLVTRVDLLISLPKNIKPPYYPPKNNNKQIKPFLDWVRSTNRRKAAELACIKTFVNKPRGLWRRRRVWRSDSPGFHSVDTAGRYCTLRNTASPRERPPPASRSAYSWDGPEGHTDTWVSLSSTRWNHAEELSVGIINQNKDNTPFSSDLKFRLKFGFQSVTFIKLLLFFCPDASQKSS